ncbi:MAG: DUF4375 domain-containing protein [Planctomycetota bacterium]
MDSVHQLEAREFIERWNKGYINGAELLTAVRKGCPNCRDQDLQAAFDSVARGRPTPASACAAAALCHMTGLGDPLDTVYKHFHESGRTLTEPQWYAWIAGYSYNWICNAGLDACYFAFGDRQFADRIRVYEAIGAETAAQVMREADQAFGPTGPAPTMAERQAAISDAIERRLKDLSPRFWACDDEIFTCVFLYALEHREDFR